MKEQKTISRRKFLRVVGLASSCPPASPGSWNQIQHRPFEWCKPRSIWFSSRPSSTLPYFRNSS